jgi:hypothetical protein
VRWTGTLIRARESGRGAGLRAVVRVHRLRSDLYGGREVDAVVELPADADVPSIGDPLTVEGRLIRADTLMRNLFVADGRVV